MKQLKRNIAIVCGGDSSEHDVSLRSAQGLFSFFDKERYNVYIVDIKGQDWHVELPGGEVAKTTLISPSTVRRVRMVFCKAISTSSGCHTPPAVCWSRP